MRKNRTYYHRFHNNQRVPEKSYARTELDALNWNKDRLNKLVDIMSDGDPVIRAAIWKAGTATSRIVSAVVSEQTNTDGVRSAVNMPWPEPQDYLNYGWYHSSSTGDSFMDGLENIATAIGNLRDGIKKYREARAFRRANNSIVHRSQTEAIREFKRQHGKVFPKGDLPTVEAVLTRDKIGVNEAKSSLKDVETIFISPTYGKMVERFGTAEPVSKKFLLNAELVQEKDGVSLWKVILITRGTPRHEDIQRGYITRVGTPGQRGGVTYRYGATALTSMAAGERELLKTLGNNLMEGM